MESRLVVTIDGRGAQTGARDVNTAVDSVRRNARDMTQQLDSSFGRLKQSLFSVQGADLNGHIPVVGNPFGAAEVYNGIIDNALAVQTIAGGHGGVGTFVELEMIVKP